MIGRETRRLTAELAGSEDERLELVLNQALDEWLRLYIVNQLKQIGAQKEDPGAPERALVGCRWAIESWRKARERIRELSNSGETS